MSAALVVAHDVIVAGVLTLAGLLALVLIVTALRVLWTVEDHDEPWLALITATAGFGVGVAALLVIVTGGADEFGAMLRATPGA